MRRRFGLRFLFLLLTALCVCFALTRVHVVTQAAFLLFVILIVWASPLPTQAKDRIIWGAVGGVLAFFFLVVGAASKLFPESDVGVDPIGIQLSAPLVIPIGGFLGALTGAWSFYWKQRQKNE